MWDQHVIVVSHRRSGTHLTIDAIRNNFRRYSKLPFLNVDHVLVRDQKLVISVDELKQELDKGPRVIKSHLLPDFDIYADDERPEVLRELFTQAKKVYVQREGKDVMVSLLKYMQGFSPKVKDLPFSDFIRMPHDFDPNPEQMSRPKFWKYHVDAWADEPYGPMFNLSFANLKTDYKGTLNEIARYLGIRRNLWTVDIRREGNKKVRGNVTSVSFNKGTMGAGKSKFTEQDLQFFEQEIT